MDSNKLRTRAGFLYEQIMEKKDELERLVDEYEFVQCKIKDEIKRLEDTKQEPATDTKQEPATDTKQEPATDTKQEPATEPEQDTLPLRYKECKNLEEMLKLLETEMKQLEETAKADFKMDDLEDNEAIMKRMAEARASLNTIRGSKSE